MPFFDLHCHPGTKTLFKDRPDQVSPWTDISVPDGLLGNSFDSQSSLRMLLEEEDINLICMAVHPPEMGMIDQLALYVAGRLDPFKKYLQNKRLRKMAEATVDYRQLLREELENLTTPASLNLNDKKVKVLKSFDEYNKDDFKTLHIIFSLEGAHMHYEEGNKHDDLEKMLQNFRDFINRGDLVLFSGLTHLTPNAFCNHAYGNKMLSKGKLLPKGHGIFDNGKALIKEIYNHNVLIDIKHMSWVARQEFYRLRKENAWDNMPLIASHIGLTGFSFTERNRYIKERGIKRGNNIYKISYHKKSGLIAGTYFNPDSINFYDEDIVEVLKSGGLIGINLDIRILGGGKNIFQPLDEEHEFITIEEFKDWELKEELFTAFDATKYNDVAINGEIVNDFWDKEELDAEKEEIAEMYPHKADLEVLVQYQPEEHLKYFINHLLKIKLIADSNADELEGVNVWDHICIGSDFDGMISAVHCCMNATQFQSFANMVQNALPAYASEVGVDLGDLCIENITKKIFFGNGYRFIKNHFSA